MKVSLGLIASEVRTFYNLLFLIRNEIRELRRTLRGSESDLLFEGVDVTVLADPWVSENPGRSEATEIEWEEGEFTGSVSGINDQLLGVDAVVFSSDSDRNTVEFSVAVNEVSTIEVIISGSNSIGNSVGNILGSSHEGSTSVGDNIPSCSRAVRTDSDLVHLKLEVGGGGEGLVSNNVTTVVSIQTTIGVNT